MKLAVLLIAIVSLFSQEISANHFFRFVLRGTSFYMARASSGAILVSPTLPEGVVVGAPETGFVFHAETMNVLGMIEREYPALNRAQIDFVVSNFSELVRDYIEHSAREQNFEELAAAQWIRRALRAQFETSMHEGAVVAINRLQLEVVAHQDGDTRTGAQLEADAREAAIIREVEMAVTRAQRDIHRFQRRARFMDGLAPNPRTEVFHPKGLFFNMWRR